MQQCQETEEKRNQMLLVVFAAVFAFIAIVLLAIRDSSPHMDKNPPGEAPSQSAALEREPRESVVGSANARRSRDDAADRFQAIKGRVMDKMLQGETDYSDIHRELAPINDELHRRIEAGNRKPGQPGYPLEARREAARRTLMQQGWSAHAAQLAVKDMEADNLLPDPPQQ